MLRILYTNFSLVSSLKKCCSIKNVLALLISDWWDVILLASNNQVF
jgi:hypothetical protein